MLRFDLRRDRIMIPLYIAIFVMIVASTASQSESLYATQAERNDYAATVAGNPGMVALVGPAYAVTNVGGDTACQMGGLGAVAAALMSMVLIGRHTRTEEQSGRSELVRAGVLGRYAPTVAALVIVVATNLVLAGAIAASLIAMDLATAGSIALGVQLGAVGLAFGGVAAVAVQVNQTTSGAYGLVGAVLGASYLLRAVGDVGDGTLSWLSPIGWGQSLRPFAGERWWPLALLLGTAVVLVAAALALLARRDDGAGIVAPKPGPPSAGPWLVRPFGLALRLQRNALVGWTLALFLSGVATGSIAQDARSVLGDSATVQDLYGQAGGSLVDNYLAVSLLSLAQIGTAFAIQSALRLRGEEGAGRVESLLAGALSRWRWAASHLAVALAGTVIVVGAGGLGAGIADALVAGDVGRLGHSFGAGLSMVPAVWVMVGLAMLLFGLVPRAALAAWGALGACFMLAYLGPLLSLPDAVMDLSPYTHLPLLPADDFALGPLVALTAVAGALLAAGMVAFRRRDVG